MRKLIISAILVSTIAVAAPAAAQQRGYNQERYGQNDNRGQQRGYAQQGMGIERELDQIEQRIDRAVDRRTISRSEGQRLTRQAEQIDRLHDRYRRNGLTQQEHSDLQNRLQNLRQQLRFERQDDRQDDRRGENRGRR